MAKILNSLVVVALIACHFALVSGQTSYGGENSEELTSATWDNRVIKTLPDINWLTVFYSPNCGRCKQFQAEFVRVANNYKGSAVLKVGSVDVPKNRDIWNRYGEGGTYPFVYFFPKGKQNTSKGSRVRFNTDKGLPKAEEVIQWVNEKIKSGGK